MRAPCTVSSRYADPGPGRQRGAAIILALLSVALAASLAAAALADFGHAYDVHAGRSEQAQSRQFALAALDWARNTLAQDQRRSASDHLGEAWAIRIPPTPIEEEQAAGVVGGHITDLSGRFNLNALHPSNRNRANARKQCERLFALVLDDPGLAASLVLALEARLAPASASGTTATATPLLQSLDTLRGLPGFSPAILEALAPHIAALPAIHPINANTATAEVLAAVIDGLDLDRARILVVERQQIWFRNIDDLRARLGPEIPLHSQDLLGVRSRYFRVDIHASYGEAVTRLYALLDREQAWPTLLWYRYE